MRHNNKLASQKKTRDLSTFICYRISVHFSTPERNFHGLFYQQNVSKEAFLLLLTAQSVSFLLFFLYFKQDHCRGMYLPPSTAGEEILH